MKPFYNFTSKLLVVLLFMTSINFVMAQSETKTSKSFNQQSFLPAPAGTATHPSTEKIGESLSRGSVAYGNNVWIPDLYALDLDDPGNPGVITEVTWQSFSGDFAPDDPYHMWIIDAADSFLKKVSVTDGSVVIDVPLMPCPIPNGMWTCITIDKVTGQFYAIGTSTTVADSRIYQVDPETGFIEELFPVGEISVISGVIDNTNILYVFDVQGDNIYRLDLLSQSVALVGNAGFDGNYAQGMGYDPETTDIYLAAYHQDVGPELRLLDKNTGSTILIAPLPGETTAFGFPLLPDEDLHVYEPMIFDNTTLEMNGNIIVHSGGSLTLDNTKLKMNVMTDGQYYIEVQDGGAMYVINNSMITDGDMDDDTAPYDSPDNARYIFRVLDGASFEMYNSELSECGYEYNYPDFDHEGLWINCDHARIFNSTFQRNLAGIVLFYSDYDSIVGNHLMNNAYGFAGDYFKHTVILDNMVENNDEVGILLWGCDSNQVINNHSVGNGLLHGITLRYSNYNQVSGNFTSMNGEAGIDLRWSNQNTINDNQAIDNIGSGIGVGRWSSDNLVSNNTISRCGLINRPDNNRVEHELIGIYCFSVSNTGGSFGNIFENNEISCYPRGVVIQQGNDNTFCFNNTISADSTGIQIDSSRNIVLSGNKVSGCLINGIHLRNFAKAIVEITSISENSGNGVLCEMNSSVMVSGCNIFANGGFGILNLTETDVIAIDNWWGDPTGPFHEQLNPGGLGNPVSDFVVFEPWLTAPYGGIPQASAGDDATIIEGEMFELADATASNYISLQWITDGDGIFSDESILNPVYFPGPVDIAVGSANLCIVAEGPPPEFEIAMDCMFLTIIPLEEGPEIQNWPGNPDNLCADEELVIDFSAVEILNAEYVEWIIEPEAAGSFDGVYFYLNNEYVGEVTISLVAYAFPPFEDAIETLTFTVFPLPVVECPVYDPVCEGSTFVEFPVVENGVYTNEFGEPVTGFDPVEAGAYSFTLTVTDDGDLVWEQVNEDGFGDPNSTFVSTKTVFDNYLYAGTLNREIGGGIWRTSDGSTWNQVNENGFGDVYNLKAIPAGEFNANIYASTYNSETGTEIWRSADGITWTQANTDGFGDPNNVGTERAAVFDGEYYIGTSNDITGGELWKTSDGTTWTQVNTDGFGDPNNVTADAYVFGNHLYIGTVNFVTGGEIWRLSDGISWTQVNTDGFGDPLNLETYTSIDFDGNLYAGVANMEAGVNIWRSSDGTAWTQVSAGGFGDLNNMWGYPYAVFNGNMYLGTGNEVTGTEVWASSNGTTWAQVNIDGFGDPNNRDSYPWSVYNDKLYFGTWNEVSGGEVWKAEISSGCSASCDFFIEVTPQPSAFAGGNTTITSNDSYVLVDAFAENHSSLMWTTSGDGLFDDPGAMNPTYTPGPEDVSNAAVDLCILAAPIEPCTISAESCMSLYIQSPGAWQKLNGPYGAYIADVVVDYSDPQIAYTAIDGGGVYKSFDAGQSWVSINSGINILDAWCLAMDPGNSQVLYLGTFHGGFYKTVNGGNSWVGINNGITDHHGFDIVINPLNTQVLYAATQEGVFKSVDAGNTWAAVNTGISNLMIGSLAINPVSPQILYAGNWLSGNNKLYKSINGGNSWTTVGTGLDQSAAINSIVIHPSTTSIIYAGTDAGVYRSLNSGLNWALRNTGITNQFIRGMTIDKESPATLYASTWNGLFKTTNAGLSWTKISNGFNTQFAKVLAVNPQNNQDLLAGVFGGMYRSMNGGNDWTFFNDGLELDMIISFRSLAVNPSDPQMIYAGSYGGGEFKSENGGETWMAINSFVPSGNMNGGTCVNYLNPNILYLAIDGAGIYKSLDAGTTWQARNEGLTNMVTNRIRLDPENPDLIYLATRGGAFKSNNGADTWTLLDGGLPEMPVYDITVNPLNTQIIYAATQGNGVYKSLNAGLSWLPVNNGLDDLNTYAVEINPEDADVLYAGTRLSGVYKSINGGNSWNPANQNIENLYIRHICISPANPILLFAGSSGDGVFRSMDGGETWMAWNDGIFDKYISSLVIDPSTQDKIIAGTNLGLYKRTLPTIPPWQEPFEDYETGSDIVGQCGWEFWFGGESSPSARVTENQVYAGEKALEIQGAPDGSGDDIVHQFAGCTSGVWEFRAMQYIPDEAAGGTTYFVLLNEYGYTLEECSWSTQIKFDPDEGIVESENEGAILPLVKGQWAEIKIIVDLNNNTQTIYYNGDMLSTKSWTEGVSVGGSLSIAAIDLYANDLSNVNVYYDDLSLSLDPNFGLNSVDAFQVSYDWGDWSEENSRVGLLSCKYAPMEQPMYLNAFTLDADGEIYWLGQNYLPDASYSSVVQKTTFNYDLAPMGIEPGIALESMPLWVVYYDQPLTDIPDLSPPETWPVLEVHSMADQTNDGLIYGTVLPGSTFEWPYYIDPLWWLGEIEELVYRGCDIPEFDLDNTNHGHNAETGYAGDWNACAPAAISSSLEWLEDVYEDSIPNCNNNQTHREVLEDLSNEMSRPPNGAPNMVTQVEGKLKYAQKHNLPLRTKFQRTSEWTPADTDIRPDSSVYSAENQTGPSGKPDWDWLVNEMKNGEDVEIGINYWDQNQNRYRGGHKVVCTGVMQLSTGLNIITVKHDRYQTAEAPDSVLQEPSVVVDDDGWLVIPALSRPWGVARVTDFISESYDKTVDYRRASGTLEDGDGNAVNPDEAEILARRWDDPDDEVTSSSGLIRYRVIGGKGFFDIDYDDFENPLQPGDRIVVTFWNGENWVTRVLVVPEDGGPIYEDVTVDDLMMADLEFTEWIQITIPPHKTLKVHWSNVTGCGNTDIVQWNGSDWFVPPYSHWNFNPTCTVKEITNNTEEAHYKRFHCDDHNGFTLDFTLVESTGNTTPGNQEEYAVVNLGGMDYSNEEFGDTHENNYIYTYEIDAQLGDFPGTLGEGGVEQLTVNFEAFDNIYWEDMLLTIDIADVVQEGEISLVLDENPDRITMPVNFGLSTITYNLGLIAPPGMHSLTLISNSNLIMNFDCFNITSLIPPQYNYDFGDAPDEPYPTLLVNNGARHLNDGTTFLGNLIDVENDGLQTPLAKGDDNDNLDDEDGVIFFGPVVAGETATLKIQASVDGYLNGWLDMEMNGSWADADDQIFTDELLSAGWNTVTYNVPDHAKVGRTFMRVRFDSQGGLSYTGPADDGEVEDYQVSILPPGWNYVQTPDNHLISVPYDVNLVGISLTVNDAFGVFYTDTSGQKVCGGAGIYDGVNNQVVLAFGDDLTTMDKEGFVAGEMMEWKIYDATNNIEQWVDVEYDPLLPQHNGTFVIGGLSALTSMTNCQELVIFENWSGISSYIVPDDPDLENMFDFPGFIILKNQNGFYYPATNTNTLGDWDPYSGYSIKVDAQTGLNFCGWDVTNTTVTLDTNWNLIPVLSRYNTDVVELFDGMNGFVAAKEVAGIGVYWPDYGIKTLETLYPGNAYFVNMTLSGSITFTAKSKATAPNKSFDLANNTPWNDVHNSPGTHLVAFAPEVVSNFENGDCIGAFTSDGLCAGMTVVTERGVALALNGDDVYTGTTDGFISGESISYKLYRPGTKQMFDLDATYDVSLDNSGTFGYNRLSAVIGANLTATGGDGTMVANDIRIFPNPSPGVFNVIGPDESAQVSVFNMYGKEILSLRLQQSGEIDLTDQPDGIYLVRLITENRIVMRELVKE